MNPAKTDRLNHLAQSAEERQLLARAWDTIEQARRGIPACTPFLSVAEQSSVERLLEITGFPRHIWDGGFPDAERKVCAFLPDWQEETTWERPFSALRCRWSGDMSLTHRDFLGALLGQGIEREKTGDLLVHPAHCDLLVFRELIPYLLQNLTSAGRVRLHVEEVPLEALEPPVFQTREIHDTVRSLRLDAVLSSGFSVARAKAVTLIAAGHVQVNHQACLKPDRAVKQGDVLSCRGLGKCVVSEVGGQTKKGRVFLTLERYL